MKKNIFFHVLLFILSLIFQFFVISDVISRTVNNLSLLFWLLSMVLFYIAFPFKKNDTSTDKYFSKSNIKTFLFATLIILFALAVRIALMTNANVFHNDEYIMSYFSYSIGDLSKLDWFGIYPIPRNWIWHFPLLTFFFQKVFFNIFGVGTLQMRLSILPYIIIVFISLFLIIKRLYTREAAFIAILILAFFSPDLYLSRWSVHIMSSTAFFLTAVYFFILSFKFGKKIHFALFGFSLGLCYMTYFSSYLAVPLILFYGLVLVIRKQIKIAALKNFLLAIGIFIYAISPLVTYALKVENFVLGRVDKVKLINGDFSPYKNLQVDSSPALEALKEQANLSFKSLYTDGIGGAGGYVFGKLALFDWVTLLFIVFSICYLLFKIIKKEDMGSLFLLVSIFATFVVWVVFTAPPPALHRFSLVFPFIAAIISITISDFYFFISRKRKKMAFAFLIICAFAVIFSNASHFNKIMARDGPDDPDYPIIQEYLEKQNEKMFYVAAFQDYGIGGILYIRSRGKINSITKGLEEILAIIPKNKTSYLVILYPNEESIQKVKAAFPNTTIIGTYRAHSLVKIN